MSLYIFDETALAVLGELEGKPWLELQSRNDTSPYCFPAWRKAWDEKVRAGEEYRDEPVASFLEGSGDGAIYGEGGYARFVVQADGELVLLRWSATESKVRKAERLGLRIR